MRFKGILLGCPFAIAVALTIAVLRPLWAAPVSPAPPSTNEPGTRASDAGKAEPELLLRGPIHEAFATPVADDVKAGIVVHKTPPQPIREKAPDMRPAGNNVVWISGYWAWDDGQNDFVWVSGVWRDAPPGRRWMPGYWAEADGGYRWIAGMWVDANSQQISYLPAPPDNVDRGPTSEAPGDNYFWISGCWVYGDDGYAWRAGYWAPAQDNWCWIPDSFCWTPRGVVFIPGYWDFPLGVRGTLFAPAFFGSRFPVGSYVYTPSIVVDIDNLYLHLFLRPACHHYYFGDYYGDAFAGIGFLPWFSFNTFTRGYDPLLTYYARQQSSQGVNAVKELQGWHSYFAEHRDLRPPHTVAALNQFAARNRGTEYAKQSLLGQPLNQVLTAAGAGSRFVKVSANERQSIAVTANALESLAKTRSGSEATGGKAMGQGAGKASAILRLPPLEEGAKTPAIGIKPPTSPNQKQPGLTSPGGERVLKTPTEKPTLPGEPKLPPIEKRPLKPEQKEPVIKQPPPAVEQPKPPVRQPPPEVEKPKPRTEYRPPASAERTPPPVDRTPPAVERTPPPVERTPPPAERHPREPMEKPHR